MKKMETRNHLSDLVRVLV